MNTKEQIIETANNLLIERGFNAFSYKNISEEIAIKTSSIHYHFPAKSDLGIAIVRRHRQALEQTIAKNSAKTALQKIDKLFLYYQKLVNAQKVCLIGALSSEINTLDKPLQQELLQFAHAIIDWAAAILTQGQNENTFKPIVHTQLKAKLLVANLMALVQIMRLEQDKQSFDQMTQLILNELIIN